MNHSFNMLSKGNISTHCILVYNWPPVIFADPLPEIGLQEI